MRDSRDKVLKGVDGATGYDSWFGRQMRRAQGVRNRAKGRKLRDHVTLEQIEEIYEDVQKKSCWVSGQTIYLARGGKFSPHAATVELAGPSRICHLSGCWMARGRGPCPVHVYKDFLECWGVAGHQYLVSITVRADGTVEDAQAEEVRRILGQDLDGNLVEDDPEAAEGQDEPGEGEEEESAEKPAVGAGFARAA
jgi:hypothetical protein